MSVSVTETGLLSVFNEFGLVILASAKLGF